MLRESRTGHLSRSARRHTDTVAPPLLIPCRRNASQSRPAGSWTCGTISTKRPEICRRPSPTSTEPGRVLRRGRGLGHRSFPGRRLAHECAMSPQSGASTVPRRDRRRTRPDVWTDRVALSALRRQRSDPRLGRHAVGSPARCRRGPDERVAIDDNTLTCRAGCRRFTTSQLPEIRAVFPCRDSSSCPERRHPSKPQRRTTRHQRAQDCQCLFESVPKLRGSLTVKSDVFRAEFDEGGGLKNRRLAPCKISIREVLISVRLNLHGEVAERLKAAVC